MEPRTLVRDFVIRNFLFGDAAGLAGDSVSLLDNGIMDSLGVMELINFLEIDLKIQVPDIRPGAAEPRLGRQPRGLHRASFGRGLIPAPSRAAGPAAGASGR